MPIIINLVIIILLNACPLNCHEALIITTNQVIYFVYSI